MKTETIKIDDILRVYSNIALNNAIFIANINKNNNNTKIKEKNFEEHLILNKQIQSKISKFNKKATKNNKNEQIDANEIKKELCNYLRNLRNFYSHHLDEKPKKLEKQNDHIKAKGKLKINEENFQEKFKKIFQSTRYFSDFATFKEKDWRIYIISLFLTNLEFSEMTENIQNSNIKINQCITNSLRNLRFRFNLYKYQEPIEMKLLNYIKSFNEIKNYKKSFANQAISLLNWKYKKKEIQFKTQVDKGQFLFSVNSDKDDIDFLFNFSQLRRILFLDVDVFISKIKKFKNQKKIVEDDEIEKKIKSSELSLDFKSFQNRFKTEKIDLRHLLKILNKILNKNYNLIIKQKHFEDLFKDLSFKNTNKKDILILKNNEDEDIKNIIEILNINDEENIDILFKIKKFIYKKIDSKEKFGEIFNKKNKSSTGNIITQNKKLMFLNVGEDLRKDIKTKFHYYISNSQKFKTEKIKSNFRKFLIPLIIFYEKNIDKKDLPLNINSVLDKNEEYVIEDKFIFEIFKNKISNNKDYKVYSTFYKENSTSIKNELIKYSNREIISSKLFSEFCKLLNINEIKTNEVWKKIIEKINWYKKEEILLFKKIYDKHKQWTQDYNQRKYRNYVFHRSISEFKNYECFEKYVKGQVERKQTPNFYNN